MEKSEPQTVFVERRRGVQWKALLIAVGVSCWATYRFLDVPKHETTCPSATNENQEFDWSSIKPSQDLRWVNCYGKGHQCARFAVPLDYSEPDGEQAAVALVRVPAKVPRRSPAYRGPILLNPGGPGGSGVDLVNNAGDTLQLLLGLDYDIIGFDPRGIGRSTPQVNIFTDTMQRVIGEGTGALMVNSTPDALPFLYERNKVFNQAVAYKASHAAEHVSTAVVARDMLSITQAHGRDKLQYWGFSYGTVLGTTYASMFPDNVGRIVVDGVVDVANYYATLWSNNLMDTDKSLMVFYESCVEAGPSKCPIYEPTAEAIAARVENTMQKIKKQPLGIYDKGEFSVINYSALRGILFIGLYKPYQLLPLFAKFFADIERGDGSAVLAFFKLLMPRCDCPSSPSALHYKPRQEAGMAVACTDGDPVTDSLSEMTEYFNRLAETSSFAEVWTIRLNCLDYKVKAKWRFNGPFVGNTSHPLLFVGNTADPVTPLWAAKKTAKGYTDAVVLTQNSPGHCSVAAISLCTFKHIRNYFRTGALPPKDTICEVQSKFFNVGPAQSFSTEEDAEMFRLLGDLGEQVKVPHVHNL